MAESVGYFTRLAAAIAGRDVHRVAPGPPPAPPPRPATETYAELAGLQLELRERDEQIVAMRKEYASLEQARDRAVAAAGTEQLATLFKKLAGPLSNLLALSDLAAAGQAVAVDDVLALVASLTKDLEKAGLTRVGHVGETTTFNPALHQRMSGGSVSPGTAIQVQLPGFRTVDAVVLKAMATARADHASSTERKP